MEVKKVNTRGMGGSYNFCQRGELNENRINLLYPYETVFCFSGNRSGLPTNICEDCLKKLNEKVNKLNPPF